MPIPCPTPEQIQAFKAELSALLQKYPGVEGSTPVYYDGEVGDIRICYGGKIIAEAADGCDWRISE